MRLWHKDLIPVLPKQQLLSQWRECCCIARSVQVNRTPNHLLVNKIMDYPIGNFYTYGMLVAEEMARRGYKVGKRKFLKWLPGEQQKFVSLPMLFKDWHNERYLLQCYYNLQEKYDCGGISKDE